jgi:Zn-dependent protease with chaperone function
MSSAAGAGPDRPPPRPNPFAFPSDTTFRFALLVAAVLGATLYVWNWMWTALGADAAQLRTAALRCLQDSQAGFSAAGDDPLAMTRASDEFSNCVQQTYQEAAWWMIGGVALVLAVAALLTIAWPLVKERRAGFEPLESEDAPEALATLVELSDEAGLRREPRWVWNPLQPTATGVAFGHPGRYAVGLTGGLVVRHATDPDGFRAIIRHELAHIRNRDVGLTYATLALWYAFLLAAVVPFAFTLIDEGRFALSVTWRLLALAALVYLTRNAVLRSREIYADVRASATDGPRGALARVVGALRVRPDRLPARLLALHPAPERRVAALRNTRPLFSIGPIEAFAAGLAATINFDSVHSLVGWYLDDPIDVAMIAAVVFAPLVVGVVGLALWRDRFGALASGTPAQTVWPLGLALVAGLLVGPELSLASALPGDDRGLLEDLVRGESLIWVVALVALVLLLLHWIANGASVWLRVEAAHRSRTAWTAGLLVAAGVLTIVLGTFYTLRQFSEGITLSKALTAEEHQQVSNVVSAGPVWLWQLVMDPQTLLLISRPLIPLAIVLLWVFPLSVALIRRRRTGEAPWAFLDPGGRLEPERPRVHLFRPVAIGVLGGLVCLLAYAVYRGGIHAFVSTATRDRDEFVLSFFFWQLVIALVAQAVAGGFAAAFARDRARLAEVLCAATVTGSIAVFGIVAGPVAGGCIDPISIRSGPCTWDVSADFAWDVWRQSIAQGAVVALLAGLVVLGAHALLSWRRRADELHPAGAGLRGPA